MRRVLILFAACLGFASPAAAVTYTYTGNYFTDIFENDPPAGSYDTSDRVELSFELPDLLAANLDFEDITSDIVSFSASDGRNTITSSDPNLRTSLFEISTDSAGGITGWNILVQASPAPSFSELLVGEQSLSIGSSNDSVFLDSALITECIDVVEFDFFGFICVMGFSESASVSSAGTWTVETAVVPLPASALLLLGGLGGLAALRRRRGTSRT